MEIIQIDLSKSIDQTDLSLSKSSHMKQRRQRNSYKEIFLAKKNYVHHSYFNKKNKKSRSYSMMMTAQNRTNVTMLKEVLSKSHSDLQDILNDRSIIKLDLSQSIQNLSEVSSFKNIFESKSKELKESSSSIQRGISNSKSSKNFSKKVSYQLPYRRDTTTNLNESSKIKRTSILKNNQSQSNDNQSTQSNKPKRELSEKELFLQAVKARNNSRVTGRNKSISWLPNQVIVDTNESKYQDRTVSSKNKSQDAGVTKPDLNPKEEIKEKTIYSSINLCNEERQPVPGKEEEKNEDIHLHQEIIKRNLLNMKHAKNFSAIPRYSLRNCPGYSLDVPKEAIRLHKEKSYEGSNILNQTLARDYKSQGIKEEKDLHLINNDLNNSVIIKTNDIQGIYESSTSNYDVISKDFELLSYIRTFVENIIDQVGLTKVPYDGRLTSDRTNTNLNLVGMNKENANNQDLPFNERTQHKPVEENNLPTFESINVSIAKSNFSQLQEQDSFNEDDEEVVKVTDTSKGIENHNTSKPTLKSKRFHASRRQDVHMVDNSHTGIKDTLIKSSTGKAERNPDEANEFEKFAQFNNHTEVDLNHLDPYRNEGDMEIIHSSDSGLNIPKRNSHCMGKNTEVLSSMKEEPTVDLEKATMSVNDSLKCKAAGNKANLVTHVIELNKNSKLKETQHTPGDIQTNEDNLTDSISGETKLTVPNQLDQTNSIGKQKFHDLLNNQGHCDDKSFNQESHKDEEENTGQTLPHKENLHDPITPGSEEFKLRYQNPLKSHDQLLNSQRFKRTNERYDPNGSKISSVPANCDKLNSLSLDSQNNLNKSNESKTSLDCLSNENSDQKKLTPKWEKINPSDELKGKNFSFKTLIKCDRGTDNRDSPPRNKNFQFQIQASDFNIVKEMNRDYFRKLSIHSQVNSVFNNRERKQSELRIERIQIPHPVETVQSYKEKSINISSNVNGFEILNEKISSSQIQNAQPVPYLNTNQYDRRESEGLKENEQVSGDKFIEVNTQTESLAKKFTISHIRINSTSVNQPGLKRDPSAWKISSFSVSMLHPSCSSNFENDNTVKEQNTKEPKSFLTKNKESLPDLNKLVDNIQEKKKKRDFNSFHIVPSILQTKKITYDSLDASFVNLSKNKNPRDQTLKQIYKNDKLTQTQGTVSSPRMITPYAEQGKFMPSKVGNFYKNLSHNIHIANSHSTMNCKLPDYEDHLITDKNLEEFKLKHFPNTKLLSKDMLRKLYKNYLRINKEENQLPHCHSSMSNKLKVETDAYLNKVRREVRQINKKSFDKSACERRNEIKNLFGIMPPNNLDEFENEKFSYLNIFLKN